MNTASAPRPGRRFSILLIVVTLLVTGGLAAWYGPAMLSRDGKAATKPGARKPPPTPLVTLAPATLETVVVRLRAVGNVEALATVAIKARVDGEIVEVRAREGHPISKGEVMFRIDPRPYEAALRQAEANAQRDLAAREQARSQARRYDDLLLKNFVSKEAHAQIRTNAQTAEAVAGSSQAALENARLNLAFCTIRAPLDGYVGRVLLPAGNLVKANDTGSLAVLNQVQPIYVSFAVPEQSLPDLRKHMAARPLVVEAGPPGAGPPARGELVFVDNTVDASTGTIKLRARFANTGLGLWPGQFVSVAILLYEHKDAVVVPALAVQTGPQGQYVYVVGDDLMADVRKVEIEREEGDRAVIAKGVMPGEKVVTTGHLRLGPKTRVQLGKPPAKPGASPESAAGEKGAKPGAGPKGKGAKPEAAPEAAPTQKPAAKAGAS